MAKAKVLGPRWPRKLKGKHAVKRDLVLAAMAAMYTSEHRAAVVRAAYEPTAFELFARATMPVRTKES